VSALATRSPQALVTDPPAAVRSAPRLFQPGEVSLEDVVLGVWEDLARDGRAGCPVCGGRIELGAGCEDCRSELS
jgi:hypothetical protein